MHKEFAVVAPSRDPRWLIATLAGIPMLAGLGLAFSGTGGYRPIQLAAAASPH